MKDLYVRFENQAEMVQVCMGLGLMFQYADQPPRLCAGNHQFSICEVGDIPGRTGWHVNIRVQDPEWDYSLLEPYLVYPPQPFCVWS